VIQNLPEVNMFKEDGEVLHFASPKVQASVGANTYVPWQLVYDGTGRQIHMEPWVELVACFC